MTAFAFPSINFQALNSEFRPKIIEQGGTFIDFFKSLGTSNLDSTYDCGFWRTLKF